MRFIIHRATYRTLDVDSAIEFQELPFIAGTASLTTETSQSKAGAVTVYKFSAAFPLSLKDELNGNMVVRLYYEPQRAIEFGCRERPARFNFSHKDRLEGAMEYYTIPEF